MTIITEAIKATKISESLENYAISDSDIKDMNLDVDPDGPRRDHVYSEERFWNDVFNNPSETLDKRYDFSEGATICEWLPRIPGLHFKQGSKLLRKTRKTDIEYKSNSWTHLTPLGKSRKVMGGLGTLKFPPDINGYRMVTLTLGNSASSGIPALISPEVWSHFKLKTGSKIDIFFAAWRSLPHHWSTKFATTRGIPKACMMIKDVNQITTISNKTFPIRYHPFSIMKYVKDGAEFFDFVFVNIDSHVDGGREQVYRFLQEYKYHEGRVGQYLIEPDMSNPLISDGDIDCHSPKELREKKTSSGAYLDLILHRVHDSTFKGHSLDEIKSLMDLHLNADTIKRYADGMGLNPNIWYLDSNTLSSNNATLLELCVETKKTPFLIDEILEEYPDIFNL